MSNLSETRGTLQEQAHTLYLEEREYKKLINKYKNNELLKQKYEIRLEQVRTEMMYFNSRIIKVMNVLEEIMKYNDIEVFIDAFNLDWEEYDEDENLYTNLMISSTEIGYCIRQALLQNEKIVKELI